ncbi:LacI family DNA-binding transcriptional regulator [Luteipulveratus flavus]|uniref:LacI family DNA-binding transcriptional regulator n=1 Tax=Luteipulveratus flavus TaxID=3031728 RepID=A0ABT6CFA2_9MICO|nr:LacI family DNA-binding transcriptional regulator [Luteipulveratus sp. YIM 133296]MDF8265961.1 LacI family DNA-binding transcriptional regulator [Luteipulveratus sp. YIM 133296]
MPADQDPAARTPRATLRDVALRAGVAISTASLVYSGKKPVAPATAEKVREAATELGYHGPDPIASSLRQGRSGVIGAVVPSRLLHAFRDPYAVTMFDGLAETLGDLGTGLLLMPESAPGSEPPPGSNLAVDAVVFLLSSEEAHPLVPELVGRGIPMVGTGSPVDPHIVQVRVDDRRATAALARHVHELGHRHVGHVLMPLQPDQVTRRVTRAEVAEATLPITRERAEGVRDVFGDVPMVSAAEADIEAGRAAADLLLGLDPRPTAILAQSDLLAVGAVRAAEARGLRVPEDVSVSGFDGVELPWLGRRLTTVDQRPAEKGRLVGEALRHLLAGESVEDVELDAPLRLGDTTAAPPRPAPPTPGPPG